MDSAANTGRQGPHSKWTLAVLGLVGVSLFAAFIALGLWQVQRLAWKLDLIDRTTERIHTAPSAPPTPAQWPQINAADHEYLAVRLEGRWLPAKTLLTQATTELGAGFWVMTPLQQDDLTQVLVNRGFVPAGQRTQWQTPEPPTGAGERITIEGLLRISEPGGGFLRRNAPEQQRWHSRDIAAMAQALQLPNAAPYFVDAGFPDRQISTNTEQRPTATSTLPRTGLTVVRFANSHLVYALTWFGLALMVVGASVVVARYELRLRARSRHPTHP